MADQSSPIEVKAADAVLYVIVDPSMSLEDVREMLRVGGVEVIDSRGSPWGTDEDTGGSLTY